MDNGNPERRQRQESVPVERRKSAAKCECPHCHSWASRVRDGRPDERGYRRVRVCVECGQPYTTFEKVA
jgi:hypothetical protein